MGAVLQCRRTRLAGWGSVVAFAMAACSAAEPQMEAPAGWQHCTNPQAGYSIDFPGNWKTNNAGALPGCSVFDPSNVGVPEGTEIPFDLAVSIVREPSPLTTALAGYAGVEILEQTPAKVDGRDAVRLEIRDPEPVSGEGPQRSTHYLINLGAETLVASTYDEGQPPYARKKELLVRMIDTLRFTVPTTKAADAPKR